MSYYECMQCSLPDLHDGQGDGIGSCECPRCEWCDAAPGMCSCDYEDEYGDWQCCVDDECSCRGVETVRPAGGVL